MPNILVRKHAFFQINLYYLLSRYKMHMGRRQDFLFGPSFFGVGKKIENFTTREQTV